MVLHQSGDRAFPQITYARGASGKLTPVLHGTRLRVQTVVIATQKWGLSLNRIANTVRSCQIILRRCPFFGKGFAGVNG